MRELLKEIFLTGDGGANQYTLKEVILQFLFITLPIIIILASLFFYWILKSEGVI